MIRSALVISLGASIGALLRWGLGLFFNTVFPTVPLGTWLANMLGGYLVGMALAYFAQHAGLSPEWRLLVITGFLGGLTTFSTFSAEVFTLLQQGRIGWACVAIGAHVAGSLLMTLMGFLSVQVLRTV